MIGVALFTGPKTDRQPNGWVDTAARESLTPFRCTMEPCLLARGAAGHPITLETLYHACQHVSFLRDQ